MISTSYIGWKEVTGIASVVIATCALATTVWQARATRRHNRLSVRPHLTTWSHADHEDGSISVDLINNGVGPALIREFKVYLDGALIEGEGTEPVERVLAILFKGRSYRSRQAYLANGYMMAAKDQREVAWIQFQPNQAPPKAEMDETLKRTRLVVRYESIYGESFVLDTDTTHTTATDTPGR